MSYTIPLSVLALLLLITSALARRRQLPDLSSDEAIYSYNLAAPNGPPQWASVLPEFALCGAGRQQSPIDIPSPALPTRRAPHLRPRRVALTVEPAIDNLELECHNTKCPTLRFRGVERTLLNVHFHSPSEHTLRGRRFPLEMHMVHSNDDGSIAVFSTLFQTRGKVQSAGRQVGRLLRQLRGGAEQVNVDTAAFLESMRPQVYSYGGSLTTPPCTEGISWLVARTLQTVLPEDVKTFSMLSGSTQLGNSRPMQPLNERRVQCLV